MTGRKTRRPVKAIAGMRDKLIHDYFGIDYELIWDILEHKISHLKKEIENILQEE